MVLYLVTWTYDSELAKGKGKIKNHDYLIGFTVLCRNSNDALKCLQYHFDNVYNNPKNLSIDDGHISLKRTTIDSRGFTANYMLMDGLREPLTLSDLKSNFNRLHKIFS